jgi:hypothetical protein
MRWPCNGVLVGGQVDLLDPNRDSSPRSSSLSPMFPVSQRSRNCCGDSPVIWRGSRRATTVIRSPSPTSLAFRRNLAVAHRWKARKPAVQRQSRSMSVTNCGRGNGSTPVDIRQRRIDRRGHRTGGKRPPQHAYTAGRTPVAPAGGAVGSRHVREPSARSPRRQQIRAGIGNSKTVLLPAYQHARRCRQVALPDRAAVRSRPSRRPDGAIGAMSINCQRSRQRWPTLPR